MPEERQERHRLGVGVPVVIVVLPAALAAVLLLFRREYSPSDESDVGISEERTRGLFTGGDSWRRHNHRLTLALFFSFSATQRRDAEVSGAALEAADEVCTAERPSKDTIDSPTAGIAAVDLVVVLLSPLFSRLPNPCTNCDLPFVFSTVHSPGLSQFRRLCDFEKFEPCTDDASKVFSWQRAGCHVGYPSAWRPHLGSRLLVPRSSLGRQTRQQSVVMSGLSRSSEGRGKDDLFVPSSKHGV